MTSDPPPPDPASVVLTFLESVGRRSDAELYLRLFRQLPKESFAVLAMEAAALRYALPSVVDQLRFLRDLGLFAPVVVGLFEPRTAERGAARLAEKCERMNPAVHDAKDDHFMSLVAEELRNEQLPIISFAKYSPRDPEERWRRVGDLMATLKSRKFVCVRRRGGFVHSPSSGDGSTSRWNSANDGNISVVNLTTDYDALMEASLPADDMELLRGIRSLLHRPDCRSAVASVTSPLSVLSELFTARGAGTFIKRGSVIRHEPSYERLDVARLRALLESSFDRKLAPDFFDRPPLSVYVEENYQGAAIVTATNIAPLLTKFAVEHVAQGEGMGRDLWQLLVRDHGSLFWRARVDNPIAAWYATLCDGMMRVGKWNIYFRGVSPEQVPAIVRHAVSMPQDFI